MRLQKLLITVLFVLNPLAVFADDANLVVSAPLPEAIEEEKMSVDHNPYILNLDDRTLQAMRRMGLSEEMIRRMGSGDIAGNGGGRIEADFHFAYTLLPKIASDCLKTPICPLENDEKKILEDIYLTSVINSVKKHKFIFLNGRDAGDLFFDSEDQQVRVAVTGFERYAPIFINLDMMYSEPDTLNHIGRILQIIIHEIGHQTGVKSHGKLDALGGKVRNFFAKESVQVRTKLGNLQLLVTNTNFKSPNLNSIITLQWQQWTNRRHPVEINLTKKFEEVASCKDGLTLTSFKISNLHWGRKKIIESQYHFPLKGWVDLKCSNESGSIITQEADFNLEFQMEFVQLPPGRVLLMKDSHLQLSR
ncbi:MAG: hypothetical protein KC493_16310 [Bacteriovoracaceae bacterium]|nr:hypothetical protein [Bacteriovoracaceae bacterium]